VGFGAVGRNKSERRGTLPSQQHWAVVGSMCVGVIVVGEVRWVLSCWCCLPGREAVAGKARIENGGGGGRERVTGG
jgi:hypothetical protein